jgi:hypothetical protein
MRLSERTLLRAMEIVSRYTRRDKLRRTHDRAVFVRSRRVTGITA